MKRRIVHPHNPAQESAAELQGTFEIPEYNHADYALATDVKNRIFDTVIGIVRRKEANACLQWRNTTLFFFFST